MQLTGTIFFTRYSRKSNDDGHRKQVSFSLNKFGFSFQRYFRRSTTIVKICLSKHAEGRF